jgi:hypothetical protein
LLDVVGRIEIGLAGRQRDDVTTGRFELSRLRRHRDGRGGLNAIQAVGDETHIVWPFETVRWRERRGHYLQAAVTSIHRAVAFPCLGLRTKIGGLGHLL